MKRSIVAVAVLGIFALIASPVVTRHAGAQTATYHVGQRIADFSLKDDTGRTVTLSQYRGKVIILNFYAAW